MKQIEHCEVRDHQVSFYVQEKYYKSYRLVIIEPRHSYFICTYIIIMNNKINGGNQPSYSSTFGFMTLAVHAPSPQQSFPTISAQPTCF